MKVSFLPRARVAVLAAVLASVALAGCFGGEAESGFSYTPGEDWKPTGNVVRLKATVLDLLGAEVHPQLDVNWWAFCFKPMDPNDEYSRNAIEYLPNQTVDVSHPDWKGTCSVPGPTLRVKQGDTVIVQFENQHVHAHTIHWHGQHVPWESDGVPGATQDSVLAGTSFTYEFVAKRAGTLWYHCHVDTQLHVMQGLYGVIIVEPQEERWEPEVDRDQVLVLSTLNRELMENTPARQADPHVDHKHIGGCGETGRPGCQNPAVDVTPDTFMINGKSAPSTHTQNGGLIVLDPGERVRLRFLNAGTTIETIHPHGHDLLITHVDGNPVPPAARVWKDTFVIGPGERVDAVIEGRAGNEGIWVMHTHVVNHVTNDGQYPGGMKTSIVYRDHLDDIHPFESELAGGQPYKEPIVLPVDWSGKKKEGLGTSQSASLGFAFPVESNCALKRLFVGVSVDSSSTANQELNDLTATITDPFDRELATLELGAKRYMEWSKTMDYSNGTLASAGEYTVQLSGRAVDAVATLEATVDYFDSIAEHDAAGGMCGAPAGGDGHEHAH